MSENEDEKFYFEEIDIDVAFPDGRKSTRAIRAKTIPELAVTMSTFGTFEVTHIASGKRVIGPYERCGSAALDLVHMALCYDFNAEDMEAERAAKADKPVPFDGSVLRKGKEERKMTIGEWDWSHRQHIAMIGEFPWESEDPFSMACDMIDKHFLGSSRDDS